MKVLSNNQQNCYAYQKKKNLLHLLCFHLFTMFKQALQDELTQNDELCELSNKEILGKCN